MKPTVGRIVHFYIAGDDGTPVGPIAGIVSFVRGDTEIDVALLPSIEHVTAHENLEELQNFMRVQWRQNGTDPATIEPGTKCYWTWPPRE